MAVTVGVNFMSVVHKSSSGVTIAYPDVCKTPSPGGPIPVPYPNVARSSSLAKGSKLQAMGFMVRMLLSRPPAFDQWEKDRGHPVLKNALLAQDSPEWRASAEKEELFLLHSGEAANAAG